MASGLEECDSYLIAEQGDNYGSTYGASLCRSYLSRKTAAAAIDDFKLSISILTGDSSPRLPHALAGAPQAAEQLGKEQFPAKYGVHKRA